MKRPSDMRKCGCNGCLWNLETLRMLKREKRGGQYFRRHPRVRLLFRQRNRPAMCHGRASHMKTSHLALSVLLALAALVVFAAYVTRNGPSAPRVDPWAEAAPPIGRRPAEPR